LKKQFYITYLILTTLMNKKNWCLFLLSSNFLALKKVIYIYKSIIKLKKTTFFTWLHFIKSNKYHFNIKKIKKINVYYSNIKNTQTYITIWISLFKKNLFRFSVFDNRTNYILKRNVFNYNKYYISDSKSIISYNSNKSVKTYFNIQYNIFKNNIANQRLKSNYIYFLKNYNITKCNLSILINKSIYIIKKHFFFLDLLKKKNCNKSNNFFFKYFNYKLKDKVIYSKFENIYINLLDKIKYTNNNNVYKKEYIYYYNVFLYIKKNIRFFNKESWLIVCNYYYNILLIYKLFTWLLRDINKLNNSINYNKYFILYNDINYNQVIRRNKQFNSKTVSNNKKITHRYKEISTFIEDNFEC